MMSASKSGNMTPDQVSFPSEFYSLKQILLCVLWGPKSVIKIEDPVCARAEKRNEGKSLIVRNRFLVLHKTFPDALLSDHASNG